ncbi:tyrosine-type recombinase/integrase [Gallibacterium anatis]|uniref:Preprotein translocase n=1 Tax=Gallibacterium anatis TaxID=750 RepID=A0A0A2XI09_9PAST|nr:tyrosine-type recombinase/integrase [Gallibacterium anatis]KGQ32006.1 preprotein translocase [Gallibacterium anatis]
MARKVHPLVDTEIKKAKAASKPYTLTDGGGLFLLISTTGSKSWRFNYSNPITKKRTKMALGFYPAISLSKARSLRDEYKQLLANDIDPQVYIKREKQNKLHASQNTFLAIAEQWKTKKTAEIQSDTLKRTWERLQKYIFPVLGDLSISSITPMQVVNIIDPLFKRGIANTGILLMRNINEIMVYAVNRGIIEFNKCTNVSATFNAHQSKHHPTIRPEELPEFLKALNDSRVELIVKLLVKFSLLTITRPSEAAHAEWQEVDFENKLWKIPAERMKMKREFIIPLSSQAIEILHKVKVLTGRSKFVFQSPAKPSQPIASGTANSAIKRAGYRNRLTSHGLRSIASTYLSEKYIHINVEIIEACLSHQSNNKVRNAYNRSIYLEQRKPLMDDWGEFVEKCIKSNI